MLKEIHKLCCPICKSELDQREDLYCARCNKIYSIRENKIHFIPTVNTIPDKLDRLKNHLKQFAALYNFLITVISPVYITCHLKRFLKQELSANSKTAINLGSGHSRISKNVINVDLFDYPNVDLVCDISILPFKDESIDLIISIAVLEHVPDPKQIVDEINRVLKPGGKIYIYIPFIQGYHASPFDYQRYTISGIKQLFNDFDITETRCGSGPTSGFLWIFQEWLALFFSFGLKPLYRFLHLLFMAITFPIKFLDMLYIHHPFAMNIASAFTVIAQKRKS